MARRKVKLTPFSRFLIFILFAAPAAYFAASYYNGEDGLQNIKDAFGIESEEGAPASETPPPADVEDAAPLDCETLREENARLRAQVEELTETNQGYLEQIDRLKQAADTAATRGAPGALEPQ